MPNVDYMTQALEVKPVSERHRVQHNTDLSDVSHALARCYRLAAGGSVNRVHLGTGPAEGRVRNAKLKTFDYVIKAMEHEQCSTYSKTVSSVSSCCTDTFQ